LSKIKFPFQKVIFTRHIARISGEDKWMCSHWW
jgi:hypothetical protein